MDSFPPLFGSIPKQVHSKAKVVRKTLELSAGAKKSSHCKTYSRISDEEPPENLSDEVSLYSPESWNLSHPEFSKCKWLWISWRQGSQGSQLEFRSHESLLHELLNRGHRNDLILVVQGGSDQLLWRGSPGMVVLVITTLSYQCEIRVEE